jgi:hypothetical protein
MLDLLGLHRGVLGQGVFTTLAGDLFPTSGELLVAALTGFASDLAVDGRDLDLLGLGAEKLALEPPDLGLQACCASCVLGVLLGQPTLEVCDQLLLGGDERLLLRDHLAELSLALVRSTKLGLELLHASVAGIRHVPCLPEGAADGKRDPVTRTTIGATQ